MFQMIREQVAGLRWQLTLLLPQEKSKGSHTQQSTTTVASYKHIHNYQKKESHIAEQISVK